MFRFPCLFLCLAIGALAAPPPVTSGWNRVQVPAMKTSIYVGSVTLTTQPFVREGADFTSTYAAKVFPWFFWSETGQIRIKLTPNDLAKLERGERCEFTGNALNHKQKPRHVTGYADPTGPDVGRIKVRIGVDDVELIFNGTYRLAAVKVHAAGGAQDSSAQ